MGHDDCTVQSDDHLHCTSNGATIFKNNPNIHLVTADVEVAESQNSTNVSVTTA